MAVILEGGCRVSEMRAGPPLKIGNLKIWQHVGRAQGAQAISLRVLEFGKGISPALHNETSDEILYVLDDAADVDEATQMATAFIDGWPFAIRPQSGIYLRPGQTFTLDNPGPEPVVLISSQCPEPLDSSFPDTSLMTSPDSTSAKPDRAPIVSLTDRHAIPTADRWYRVLVDEEVGSTQATQFVGSIPPGRAPDHFHDYEEVLFILRGQGRMWAGETNTSIGFGSCIYLPKGQAHCVENTGNDELRLLGVFYPAGSPSVRYDVST